MIIGQNKIMNELNIILPQIKNNNQSVNFLLRAPSGYGKTSLSFIMAQYLSDKNFNYYIPDKDGNVIIDTSKRVHIVDEVHTCKNQEQFYPLLDENKFIFIFITNETGQVKEPLINRCINYIFDDYCDKDINEIVDNILGDYIPIGFNYYHYFTDYTHVPRIIVKLCQRLIYIFNYYGIPDNDDLFRYIFEDVINIHDGLDNEQRRYIEFIRKVNTASLDLISASINIDKDTIKRDIEPGLIYRNLISITSRGRKYINE